METMLLCMPLILLILLLLLLLLILLLLLLNKGIVELMLGQSYINALTKGSITFRMPAIIIGLIPQHLANCHVINFN